MASSSPGAGSTPQLPDYVPVPEAALGPALNEQGYFVGRVERNLFWVTDGTYQSAFLATGWCCSTPRRPSATTCGGPWTRSRLPRASVTP